MLTSPHAYYIWFTSTLHYEMPAEDLNPHLSTVKQATWRDHRITLLCKTYPCKQLVADQENFHCCRNPRYNNLLHTVHLYGALYDQSESYMMVYCSIKVSVPDLWCSLETDAQHHLNLARGISSTERKIKNNNQIKLTIKLKYFLEQLIVI